jgi:hypothetical protein
VVELVLVTGSEHKMVPKKKGISDIVCGQKETRYFQAGEVGLPMARRRKERRRNEEAERK